MKKTLLFLLTIFSIQLFAQDIIPFAQCDKNTVATYALLRGEKKKLNFGICYYRFTTDNVIVQADGSKAITYKIDLLNKKKQVSSMSNMVGTKGGYYNAIQVMPDGSYKMDQDLMWGVSGRNMARGGFMFVVPGQMTTGQMLECGTVRQEYEYEMMGRVYPTKTNFTYYDVQVVKEEEITVGAGTFQCVVLDGKIKGSMEMSGSSSPMNKHFIMWLAPGIGVVRYQVTLDAVYNIELQELVK